MTSSRMSQTIGFLLLDHLLGLLDGGAVPVLFKLLIDERLEQLKRHLLGQTALVQFQFRTDHDNRTAGVVDALTEQVLTETALFAFERVGQRLQRTVVRRRAARVHDGRCRTGRRPLPEACVFRCAR